MDRPHVAPYDLMMARRLRDGRLPAASLTSDRVVRLAWIHARLFGDEEATRRLDEGMRRCGSRAGARIPPGLVTLVRAADGADRTPAATSIEFAWRHPELLAPAGA